MALPAHQREPAFGMLLGRQGPASIAADQSAMGTWPYSGILAIPPVIQIVLRFMSGDCVIGNFIGGKSRRFGKRLSDFVEHFAGLLARHGQLALRRQGSEGRVGLNRQLIERHVSLLFGKRLAELTLPLSRALSRPRINEIEG